MPTLQTPDSPSTVTSVGKVRVLVVDDSLIYRKVVRDALAALPNVSPKNGSIRLTTRGSHGVVAL